MTKPKGATMMGNEVSDAGQRRLAIDPAQSFIIQAPAGSGKTGLLIQRYLRLLCLVEQPEEIVAITFTRKAAAEMQGRILNALYEAAADDGDSAELDAHQRETLALARVALERDRQRQWGIAENPSRLRVQTIDALCAWLSRQLPLLSGLGVPPEISDDTQALYQSAARQTLAILEDDGAQAAQRQAIADLLTHLDGNISRAIELLAGMLSRRDQWIRHVVNRRDRVKMEGILSALIAEALERTAKLLPAAVIPELLECIRYSFLNNDLNEEIKVKNNLESLPGTSSEELLVWLSIADVLLTKDGAGRRKLDKRQGFLPKVSKDMKQQTLLLIQKLAQIPGFAEALHELRDLPNPPKYTEDEWKMVDALCRSLELAAGQLRVCMADSNRIDFIGMSEAATAALGSEDEPTDMGLYLEHRIRHILLDEFQDISLSQYELLARMCAGWGVDDGHSLFLVGDPMQSIYRFREAEVGIFLEVFGRERFAQVPLQALRLTANFRSLPSIVEWVNECFKRILPAKEDIMRGAVGYTASAPNRVGEGGGVSVYPSFVPPNGKRNDAAEARQVVSIINEISAATDSPAAASIAILVRNRTHLTHIIPLLRGAGLRFRAVEIEGMSERPAIQDVLMLTRAFLHLADRVAWLSLLRSPWCGLDLQSLWQIARSQRTIWESLQDEESLRGLSVGARQAVERLRPAFAAALEHRQRRPLRCSIEGLWLSLGGPACLGGEEDLDNVTDFLKLLEDFDKGGYIEDLSQFEARLGSLFAAPDHGADGSLQLMTIHRAKGLEFDHVIVPGLGRSPRSDGKELLMWMQSLGIGAGGGRLLLAPIAPVGSKDLGVIYKYIRELRKQKNNHEARRLLYVAATRARITLHLLAHTNIVSGKDGSQLSVPKGTLLECLWEMLEGQFQEQWDGGALEETAATGMPEAQNAMRRLRPDWRVPEAEPGVRVAVASPFRAAEEEQMRVEYDWAGMNARRLGTVVHRLLMHMGGEDSKTMWADADGLESPGRLALYRQMLLETGVPAKDIQKLLAPLVDALRGILADPQGRWILNLDGSHGSAHSEYGLSGWDEGRFTRIVIDRSFVDSKGVRWIVDYKISHHSGGKLESFLDREKERYRPQLEKYARMLQKCHPQQSIRMGLYFPILKAWREWGMPE
ncbi:MAG: UvrD-helicase domain-containing protein [Candidatus Eutrophobiaceae bacterium]